MKKLLSAMGKRYLGSYKRRKQKLFNGSLAYCLNTSRAMLKKSKYCILITNIELMNFKRNVVPPEPFGLKPVRLKKTAEGWLVQ